MVPFANICPKLANDECRAFHLVGNATARDTPSEEYALFESYCTDKGCDCRRVVLTVASRKGIEATINFAFDPNDKMRGPFLDPLNKQGPNAKELLSFVRDSVLSDPEYVARLERHYTITKDIIAGRLRPEDAPPSPRLERLTEVSTPPAIQEQRKRSQAQAGEPELVGLPFDIYQTVFDEYGEYDEDRASDYREQLESLFADSPEAQPLLESGSDLGWAETMMHYGIVYRGETPPGMSASSVAEVVFEIFPRKVSMDADQAGEVIAELRAFWQFMQRQYRLKNAARILELLGPGAEERLHDELDDPANFGMAKSFFMAGKTAGFDMTSKAGLAEFMLAYNAGILGNRGSVGRPLSPQEPPGRLSMFADDERLSQFGNRSERRAAERDKLREDKKRKRQAKRRNRR